MLAPCLVAVTPIIVNTLDGQGFCRVSGAALLLQFLGIARLLVLLGALLVFTFAIVLVLAARLGLKLLVQLF